MGLHLVLKSWDYIRLHISAGNYSTRLGVILFICWREGGLRGAGVCWRRAKVSLDRIVVFLLAENCLLREALVRVLRKKDDLVVAGAIPFSCSALQKVSSANPDIVLFDSASIALTGPRLVARMRQAQEGCKAVMIGMDEDEATFLRAVGEGVIGYVLKDASAAEIVRVIRAVAAGEAVCPPRFSLALFQCAARDVSFSITPPQKAQFGLTRREQQLVGLIRLGLSNKEIGSHLNLSEQTVKNHIHNMLRKIGANDRLEIVERCQTESAGLVASF
jgi:DNA-binding NarL/FixJ family response regulator